MTAEYLDTWSPEAITVANQALMGLLDAHPTEPARITIHSGADTLLASITLTKPCGVIDGAGLLTLIVAAHETDAPAEGTASYATVRDGYGVAHSSMTCIQGGAANPGYCVISSITVFLGGTVRLVSAVIG